MQLVPDDGDVYKKDYYCAWCGAETTNRVDIDPARWGKAANGVRVLKRRAITAACCDQCSKRLLRAVAPEPGVAVAGT